MRKRLLILCAMVLMLSWLTACGANQPPQEQVQSGGQEQMLENQPENGVQEPPVSSTPNGEQPSENQTPNSAQQPPENQTPNGTQQPPVNQAESAGQPAGKEILTAEEVQQRALAHAGLKAEDVTYLRTDYDRDEQEYEVDFLHDGWEYEYEIHAISGMILSADKERWD